MTLVDRATSCILAWAVDFERPAATIQAMLDTAPQATYYYSDLYATYRSLVYTPGIHSAMLDKSETYRVEGDNAELRHYLARLGRRSRCFSRSIHALRRAIKLFVAVWNQRQLRLQQYPRYRAELVDFV